MSFPLSSLRIKYFSNNKSFSSVNNVIVLSFDKVLLYLSINKTFLLTMFEFKY